MSSLGARMKHLREKMGRTQREVADKVGVSVVTLSRYETNDRKPEPETLKAIADVLETSGDYLIGRTDDPRRHEQQEDFDPEFAELLAEIEKKGMEQDAKIMLRTASKMGKNQLRDVLKVLNMIEHEDDDEE